MGVPGGGAFRETQGASPLSDVPRRGAPLFPKRVGLPRVPLQESASSTLWDPGTLPGGLLGGRCGCRTWERSLRTPTCRRGHRQYLRSGPPYDFPRYRSKVHEVTQAFAAVSREVLAVEAELAGPRAQPLLAGHVRSLQQLEQTRLATVRTRPRSLFPTPKPGLYRGGLLGPLCAFEANGHIPVPHNPVPGAPDPTSNYPTSVFH